MKKKRIEIKLVNILAIFMVIIILSRVLPSFGRYIYRTAKDKYLSSKEFYFTSNLMQSVEKKYEYVNWGGDGIYSINVKLYSYKNELLKMKSDLGYNLKCEVIDEDEDDSVNKVDCGINSVSNIGSTKSTSGTIYLANNNEEDVNVYIIPKENVEINKGDIINIRLTASTEYPYATTISAVVSLEIKDVQMEYNISDQANQLYATLEIKNTQTADRYVTLNFDASKIRIDMNNQLVLDGEIKESQKIDGVEYADEVTIEMSGESTAKIKFYKVDKSENYTYPNGDKESVINVNFSQNIDF
jgi:hypothetical protein